MQSLHHNIIFFCLFASATAWGHTPKEGDVWTNVGPFLHRTKTPHGIANEAAKVGGGIVVEGDVDYNGGVEIAMIYVDKLYVRKRDEDVVAERIKRMYITTGYRHWFVPAFSTGLAFFSGYSMGDPKVVLDERPSGDKLVTSARKITEYGFDTSVQWQLYGDERFGAVVDFRYSWSLSREEQEDADTYGAMLSFKYLVPKRG